MDISSGMVAIAATLFGGVGLKVVESWLRRNRDRVDVDMLYRKELRDDLNTIREELKETTKELDSWRDRYYEQQARLNDTVAQLTVAVNTIKQYTERAERDQRNK